MNQQTPKHAKLSYKIFRYALLVAASFSLSFLPGCGGGNKPTSKVDQASRKLVHQLHSESPSERELAAQQLGEKGIDTKEAIEALVEALDDEEDRVRLAVITALGKLGKTSVVKPLTPFFKSDIAPEQKAAATALAQLGPDGLAQLNAALKSEDELLCLAALFGLRQGAQQKKKAANDSNRETVTCILALLNDKRINIKRAALTTLASYHNDRGDPSNRGDRIPEAVAKVLSEPLTATNLQAYENRINASFTEQHKSKLRCQIIFNYGTKKMPEVRGGNVKEIALRKTALVQEAAQLAMELKQKDSKETIQHVDDMLRVLLGNEKFDDLSGEDLRNKRTEKINQLSEWVKDPNHMDATQDLSTSFKLRAGKRWFKAMNPPDHEQKLRKAHRLPIDKELKTISGDIRREAVETLASIGTSRAITELVKAFVALEDHQTKALASAALAKNMDQALDPLIEVATDGSQDSTLRISAFNLLIQHNDPQAQKCALSLLTDPNLQLRMKAVESISQTQNPQRVEPLLKALEGANSQLKQAIFKTLGNIGDKRATVVAAATQALNDSDVAVQTAAVDALGFLGNPKVIPDILKKFHLAKEKYEQLKNGIATENEEDKTESIKLMNSAMIALGKLKAPEVFNLAIAIINKPMRQQESDQYEAAAKALGALGDKRAVKPLNKLFQSGRDGCRIAGFPLAQLKDPSSVDIILNGIRIQSNWLLQDNLGPNMLSAFKTPNSTRALIKLLVDKENRDAQKGAAKALVSQGASAVPEVRKLLKDKNLEVSGYAARVLGKIGEPAIPALAEESKDAAAYLSDSSGQSNRLAQLDQMIFALSQTKSEKALPVLYPFLNHKDARIRGRTAFSLGEMRLPLAIPTLTSSMGDPNQNVALTVKSALVKLGKKNVK